MWPFSSDTRELLALMQTVIGKLDALIAQGDKIMATLADVQAKVTAEDTVIDSAMVLLASLADMVRNLQPNQAAIDALAADIDAKTKALADATVANTPSAP